MDPFFFFDSHAHLTAPELLPHLESLLDRCRLAGVRRVVNICTDQETLRSGLEWSVHSSLIVNAGATTPHDVAMDGERDFSSFESAARSGQLVAIGETGLDYYYKELDRKTQQRWMIRYLHLAAELGLPVIFHCREAFADLFAIADAEYPRGAPAILHCFTGSMLEAREVWDRGWYLSLSGIVTFAKSESLRQVAAAAPLNQLLIETDAPYLAPQSRRGRLNEPAYLPETAAVIARAKGISVEEVARATYENGCKVFRLSN